MEMLVVELSIYIKIKNKCTNNWKSVIKNMIPELEALKKDGIQEQQLALYRAANNGQTDTNKISNWVYS
jgi:hypothetical protein